MSRSTITQLDFGQHRSIKKSQVHSRIAVHSKLQSRQEKLQVQSITYMFDNLKLDFGCQASKENQL